MAYRDFTAELVPSEPLTANRLAAVAGLSDLERRTLRLARRDPAASAVPPSRLGRRLRRLFGVNAPNPLADPRLEALRRYAVMLRHHTQALPRTETERLRNAGFSERQIFEVRELVCKDRIVRQRRARLAQGAALWVPTLGFAGWVQGSLTAWLGDPLIGLVVTLLAMLPIMPLVAAGHA